MMNDVVDVIERTAQSHAKVLHEKWDDLPESRREMFRKLAYLIYTMHIKNKLMGMQEMIQVVEDVQTAGSTPKRWLPGVKEAKNAMLWYLECAEGELSITVEVPEVVPTDLEQPDPYAELGAEDTDPYNATEGVEDRCGWVHPDEWSCTRPNHPDHWQHWDAESGGIYPGTETHILATWFGSNELDTIHRAVLAYENGEMM